MYKADLRYLREQAGLRQDDVARACGCTSALVSMWEHGKTVPSKKDLGMLERLYGIKLQAIKTYAVFVCSDT